MNLQLSPILLVAAALQLPNPFPLHLATAFPDAVALATDPGYTGIRVGGSGSAQMVQNRLVVRTTNETQIIGVAEGSPAAKAGLAVGDVILEVNGMGRGAWGRAVGQPEAGATYVFRVRRGEAELEFTLVAEPVPPRP
jgi:S1-C subfamily serine protease